MSDISRSAVLQINVDGNNAKGTIEEINQAFGRAALKGTSAFKEIGGAVDMTVVKVDNSISAFDRFIRTVENSSKRSSAAKWVEGLDNVEAELKRIQASLTAASSTAAIDGMSADAAQLAANLNHVHQQLTKINALQATARVQAGVANTVSGMTEVNRYQQWLASNADPAVQGYRNVPVYDIDTSNVEMLRQQGEANRYQQWLANNADPSVQGYRNTHLYDIDMSNVGAIHQDEAFRYKAALREMASRTPTTPQHFPQQTTDAEAMLTHTTYLQDRERLRDEARQRDRENQARIRREDAARHDRALGNDPNAPNYYAPQYHDELTGDFKRDRWVRDNREYARRSQMGTPNLLDESDLARRYQDWDSQHGQGGQARRNFIAQQGAFAVDDAMQQFMWSNSTGAGISAASRAAGNNLTAVAANMDVSPTQMVGAMVAIQAISGLSSYIGRMADETLKAAKNTDVLEKSISRYGQSVDRAGRFDRSLKTGDAKSLSSDQDSADSALEVVSKKLAYNQRLAGSQDRLMKENAPSNSWGEWIAQGWGLYGLGSTESSKRYLDFEGAKSRRDALSKDANELALEKKTLEEEKIKRLEAIETRSRSEGRRTERAKRGAALGDRFDIHANEYEDITGRIMSGSELKDAYDYMVENNPDADLSETRKSLDSRMRKADYRIRSEQRQADKFFNETKSEEDFNRSVKENPFGDILKDFNDFVKEVNDQSYLPDDKKRELIAARQSTVEEDIGKKRKDMDDDLRRSYRPNEGISSGSYEDTELKAKLTALTDDPNAKDQTELLRQIADNTKPKPPPPDKVVDLGDGSE